MKHFRNCSFAGAVVIVVGLLGTVNAQTPETATIPSIALKIKIPDSMKTVTTEVAVDSTVPDCVRKDPSSVEENGGITVTAEVFTECARKELRRINEQLDEQSGSGKPDNAAEAEEPSSSPSGISPQAPEGALKGGQGSANKDQENPSQGAPADPGTAPQYGPTEGEGSTPSKDGTSAYPTPQGYPGSGSDMPTVFRTVFDYRRVMDDLRRILRGELLGVVREYPGRMADLLRRVNEMPARLVNSIGIVNRLRSESTEVAFRGVLTNLREYLIQASQTAKDLPTALTLVNVMDTLRNMAQKIGGGAYPEQQGPQSPSQVALLSRLEEILSNPLGKVLNMAPVRAMTHGVEQRRQLLARRIYNFHPERFLPAGLHPRNIFNRRPHQVATEES